MKEQEFTVNYSGQADEVRDTTLTTHLIGSADFLYPEVVSCASNAYVNPDDSCGLITWGMQETE